MLVLDAREFAEVMRALKSAEAREHGQSGPLTDAQKDYLDEGIEETIRRLEKLDLPVSVTTAREMCLRCGTHEQAKRGVEQLTSTVVYELDNRKFYGPLRRYEQYYEQSKLFGNDVFENLPSANNDILEAGTCLALERGSACVMHLMRVVEAGLKVLAAELGIGVQGDWGSYLREIDTVLKAREKAAGKRTPDEQFYAEAALTIDGVRRAWRNPTMHIENNYSPERAEEILLAVRSLMRHLATKLIEW
jgi:hypothetical protein